MARNIVIFSDGTGQRGGIFLDERRSNIYKLFRATRCGPESSVDPAEQLSFYDPGIGTLPDGLGALGAIWQRLYNIVSQALGLGLTGNIVDCYAAIVRMWRPGDRIFLFGFSRGAYTVRCLGGVIALCGVPTVMDDNKPLRRDESTSKKIAKEAVKKVYQHTSSRKEANATPRQRQQLQQRRLLARRFRLKYGSGDDNRPTTYPYFIGVFDTVASLANPVVLFALSIVGIALVVGLGTLLWWLLPPFCIFRVWWVWPVSLAVLVTVVASIVHTLMRIRSEVGLQPRSWWRFFHLTAPRMKFYDTDLSTNVAYARHAISIDEARSSFQRVGWGTAGDKRETAVGAPEWFQQIWFAGNHSDIGGSYPEVESRLSDITLKWMLDAAVSVGLKHDATVLRLYPDATGPQHDETKSSIFRFAGKMPRAVGADFPLHESVVERFKAKEVHQYDMMRPYRPESLRGHQAVGGLFE